jgi:hypothetical protein
MASSATQKNSTDTSTQMPCRPSRADIDRQDQYQLKRQQDFRTAADAVAAALEAFTEVEKIALFGSAARPLVREVPRFQPYRQLGIEVLHECKDVDLAVWLAGTNRLRDLGRARSQALSQLYARTGTGVAQHQVDVFLLASCDGHYLGRLCGFASCPKGKPECLVPGCGGDGFAAVAALASGVPRTRKPKNRGPFQAVPVIVRAIAERLK